MASLEALVVRHALRRADAHRYGKRHRTQCADLHLPAARGSEPDRQRQFPVVVLIHGGHWQPKYGRRTVRPLAADLAARGWAAWNIEYRRLGRGQGGGWPATFDDVAEAIDHLAKVGEPRLDLERVSVVGHSAGGQLALWAAGRSEIAAGAPGAAPTVHLRACIALTAVSDLVKAGAPAVRLLGGSPEQVPDRYELADPVQTAPPPVPALLIHPADDDTVPVARSRDYVRIARAAGGDAELIEPEHGGHRGPIHPADESWAQAVAWLEYHGLGPSG